MGCGSGKAVKGVSAGDSAYPHDAPRGDDDRAPAELKSRELPIIPETGFQDDVASNASSRVASITTVGTPKSMPLSHLDSVANSMIRAEVDRESFDGRSMGIVSTTGTFARQPEDDSRSLGPSIPESRLDSQNYLADLDKMVQDDRALGLRQGSAL
mmetsp:Transcript_50766/g.117898  ORF Transcript_50766/g.117898 Transcript_50766/m.117898 type:complete len:156 (-) Transcript_50766:126-593(-)|eukprot:CAMPEP_0171090118 /NCGR_PEP_ID=MMETSP0766_2-20121228/29011_1 /TAXON_ID=439317 /ORGANISM="Gambierdiscus australes, Strain CAWD 149" /LENGTH=155 /DNA_ID=CAMNT_0011548077 /DNA_START=42 /DNA_END=509 /DNA_ORIENTATION=-